MDEVLYLTKIHCPSLMLASKLNKEISKQKCFFFFFVSPKDYFTCFCFYYLFQVRIILGFFFWETEKKTKFLAKKAYEL